MSNPHMNLRGLDTKSHVDVKRRAAQYSRIASFMNADPDEIGKFPPFRASWLPGIPNTALFFCY